MPGETREKYEGALENCVADGEGKTYYTPKDFYKGRHVGGYEEFRSRSLT